jgi:hypothetical protein
MVSHSAILTKQSSMAETTFVARTRKPDSRVTLRHLLISRSPDPVHVDSLVILKCRKHDAIRTVDALKHPDNCPHAELMHDCRS